MIEITKQNSLLTIICPFCP